MSPDEFTSLGGRAADELVARALGWELAADGVHWVRWQVNVDARTEWEERECECPHYVTGGDDDDPFAHWDLLAEMMHAWWASGQARAITLQCEVEEDDDDLPPWLAAAVVRDGHVARRGATAHRAVAAALADAGVVGGE